MHQALSGETSAIDLVPSQLFRSCSMPIDARVSDKVRARIWSNEYIDFGTLLTNPLLENKFQISLTNPENGPLPSLCLESISKPKKITSIDLWVGAFHVFVGVYTSKYPTEAPSLMKYGGIIQELAARGHNWKFYDENVRFFTPITCFFSALG